MTTRQTSLLATVLVWRLWIADPAIVVSPDDRVGPPPGKTWSDTLRPTSHLFPTKDACWHGAAPYEYLPENYGFEPECRPEPAK
jgi:hypothetical protein